MKININLANNPYYVNIDEDIQMQGEFAILTNETLKDLYLQDLLDKLGKTPKAIVVIKDGEEYKNIESLNYICNELFNAKLSRNATLINLGGGVISDLGGFVSSIYKRGIKHINIATTLLASVDAAVGGKTGINNDYGKNLLGTFKQPSAVYIFTNYFKTLNDRELSAAMAEILKMALCFDLEFFCKIQNIKFDEILDNIYLLLENSIKIKAEVVIKDEKENNLRMKLNYGHTFAHVIENLTNYKSYLHGEAVAIGMIMANELAYKLDLIDLEFKNVILNSIKNYKLPYYFKIKDEYKFYDEFFQDKKSLDDKINFILLSKSDKCIIKSDIKKDDVIGVLREFKK